MTPVLACDLALPPNFRPSDILAFHRRDTEAVAERVEDHHILKGQFWDGQPACLSIHFGPGEARVALAIDGEPSTGSQARLENQARRMLGLTQPVEAFEAALMDHPQIGPVITRNRGLRVPLTASPFEALTWAITGQQISVSAAVSVRRRFIQAVGVQHSSGLWCVPDPGRVMASDLETLRGAGLSRTKAQTIQRISELMVSGELPLDDWTEHTPAEHIAERLQQVRGIGPWTISYALMRGFGWLDGSLHGDVAVRRNLQTLLDSPEKPSEQDTKAWLADFSPWRALVAAHLWAMQSAAGY